MNLKEMRRESDTEAYKLACGEHCSTALHDKIISSVNWNWLKVQSLGVSLYFLPVIPEITRCMSDTQYSFKGYILNYTSVYLYKQLEALPKQEIQNVCAK